MNSDNSGVTNSLSESDSSISSRLNDPPIKRYALIALQNQETAAFIFYILQEI